MSVMGLRNKGPNPLKGVWQVCDLKCMLNKDEFSPKSFFTRVQLTVCRCGRVESCCQLAHRLSNHLGSQLHMNSHKGKFSSFLLLITLILVKINLFPMTPAIKFHLNTPNCLVGKPQALHNPLIALEKKDKKNKKTGKQEIK